MESICIFLKPKQIKVTTTKTLHICKLIPIYIYLVICWVNKIVQGAPFYSMWEESYCEVVIDELRPSEQVSEPVESSQFAAEKLLALVVGNGVWASQIIDWRHHSQTYGEK